MSKWTDTAIKCIEDEAKALLDLIPLIDGDFDKTVEIILNCKGKLIVTGVGKSGHIGAKIAATLSSTGTPSFFINPLDVFHGDLGVIQHDDVVLAISNSGQTDELLRFLPYLLENHIPVIGMSGNPKSLLAQYANAMSVDGSSGKKSELKYPYITLTSSSVISIPYATKYYPLTR